MNTASTRDAYIQELVVDQEGKPRYITRTGDNMSMLATTAVDCVRSCCEYAARSAGLTLDQIDYFAFNTPTAWYADVCIQALGIEPERTMSIYDRYANIGPVYPIANLYHAALDGRICENNLVLVYSNGAGATAAAMIIRWGSVALGSLATIPTQAALEPEKFETTQIESDFPKKTLSKVSGKISKEQILASEPEQRRHLLETYLSHLLKELLQHPEFQLEMQDSLRYLVDSLIALEITRRTELDLGVKIPMAKLFEDNHIENLIDCILNQLILNSLTKPSSLRPSSKNDLEEIVL